MELLSPASRCSECGSGPKAAIIGVIIEGDFERAQATIPEFARYCDYKSYCLERESLQIGLSLAGLDAAMLPFKLSTLLEWRKLSGIGEGEDVSSDAHDLWIGGQSSDGAPAPVPQEK